MKKIIIALIFSFTITSLCLGEAITIGVVKSQDISPYNAALRGFKYYLANQRVDARINEYNLEDMGKQGSNIGKDIKVGNPELILTLGTQATKLTQGAIRDIPAVFTMVLAPKKNNILIPGVSMDIPAEVKLRQLKKILPGLKRVGLIYSRETISAYEEIKQACAKLALQLIAKQIKQKEFPEAFEDISAQIDCFLMIADSSIYFLKSVEYLLSQGLRNKIPVVGLSASYTKAGALISFDCDYEDLGRQTAELALKMLVKGTSVNAQFVGPRKIRYSLNLLVAERLQISISPEIIGEAGEVFGK